MAFHFIKNLFTSGKLPLKDFSFLNADMHSHLVPEIDDGSKSLDDSVQMIKMFSELGYRKLITTPHIMSDYYKNTPEIIRSGLEIVRKELMKQQVNMELDAAAEYYLDDGFMQKLEEGNLLTFGKNYLLFEVSYINCPENLRQIIFQMMIKGYQPVLAHPERYPFWFNKFHEFQELKDSGVLLQVNLNSLSGYYGPEARRMAEKLIDLNLVDFAGTDLHKVEHAESLKKLMTMKYFHKLSEMNLLNKTL